VKRILLLAAGALVLAIGVAVWLGLSQLDTLVADAIEKYGSEITGVPVRVGSVKIELGEGRGGIAGLRVGNPEGFSAGDAFTLGEITLDIDIASLTSSPIVIEALTVSAPEARYELDASGRANFDVIRDNVKRYSSASAPSGPKSASEPEAETGDDLRLSVTRFRVDDGGVTMDVAALHEDVEPRTLKLPAVAIDDIGGSEGLAPGELGAELLGSFTKSVRKAAGKALKSEARRALEKVGGDAGRAAGELLDKLF
jgi:hypothetical protein